MVDFSTFGIADEYMKQPGIAGKYSGLLIIAASGRCVWNDLEKAGMARNDNEFPHIMCVNDMIMYYPGRVIHAYSNNHEYLPKWLAARRDQYLTRWECITKTHSNRRGSCASNKNDYIWPWPGHGTSLLGAVYTGLALGYDQIWICGGPLDDSGRFFEPPWVKSNFEHEIADRDGEIKYWGNAKRRIFEDKVRSFSGRTMDLLGYP